MTDFDKLMERYDNLIRQNAYLEAQVKTLQQKCEFKDGLNSNQIKMIQSLGEVIRDLKSKIPGMENEFMREARQVYRSYLEGGMDKIQMIKEVRERVCGTYPLGQSPPGSLKSAKDAVEQVMREYGLG